MAKTIVTITGEPKVYRLSKAPAERHKMVTVVFSAALLAEETIATVAITDPGALVLGTATAVGQAVELDLGGGNNGEEIVVQVTVTGTAGSIRQATLLVAVRDPALQVAQIIVPPGGIVWRDNWSIAASYVRGDVVRYGAGCWLALQPNAAVTPTGDPDWLSLTGAVPASIDNSLNLMTRAEFEGLANHRRNHFAGSGFVEWGKHYNSGSYPNINDGFWTGPGTDTTFGPILILGTDLLPIGISKSNVPLINCNGYLLKLVASSGQIRISFPPAPATSALLDRQDLVFLEVWHEDVSEKDFVCPYGNTQYGPATYTKPDGTTIACASGAFSGFGTYSLFGNWQAASALIGKGMVWSTMPDANKRAFCSDPDNNMYLDGQKVIQVRYRIRVVEGPGSSWANVSDFNTSANNFGYSTALNVWAKGKAVTVANDLGAANTARYTTTYYTKQNIGAFQVYDSPTSFGYNGLCFALPIALVHRRNQGAYHPVFNPNGTAKLTYNDAGNTNFWYAAGVRTPTTVGDCFNFHNPTTNASGPADPYGNIASNKSGRPDGLFFDEINERDVKDLRNSAIPVRDQKRLLEREFNKLVAGTTRGWGSGRRLVKSSDFRATSTIYVYGASNRILFYINATSDPIATVSLRQKTVGATVYVFYRGTVYTCTTGLVGQNTYFSVDSASLKAALLADNGNVTDLATNLPYPVVLVGGTGTDDFLMPTTASKTLLACDIIGDPANYPQSWKDNGVAGTPLLVAEDGVTSLIPNGGSQTWKMSRKVKTCLRVLTSSDSGATWSVAASESTWITNTQGSSNANTTSLSIGQLVMVFYLTEASPFDLAAAGEFLALRQVWASGDAYLGTPSLVQALIGKIPDAHNWNLAQEFAGDANIGVCNVTAGTTKIYSSGNGVSHPPISLSGGTGPACKALPHLVRSNGKAYLQMLYKEMFFDTGHDNWADTGSLSITPGAAWTAGNLYKVNDTTSALNGRILRCLTTGNAPTFNAYQPTPNGYLISSTGTIITNCILWDGFGWGDDSKFTVVDNESTATDLNGKTIKVGQKRLELPFFIGDGE